MGRRLAALLIALLCACGDDDDSTGEPDAAALDAGPWESGELACDLDVTSDYASRTYSFADGFDRRDLGPNWHTAAPDKWVLEEERRLVVSGEGGDPGNLAMVSDGKTGTDIVAWVDLVRPAWTSPAAVLCRADGPPMTAGYGARIREDGLDLIKQDGTDATTDLASESFDDPLPADARIRVVVGCTGQVVAAFLFAVGADGSTAELACASIRTQDHARVGAVGLTHDGGRTAFDDVRVEIDP